MAARMIENNYIFPLILAAISPHPGAGAALKNDLYFLDMAARMIENNCVFPLILAAISPHPGAGATLKNDLSFLDMAARMIENNYIFPFILAAISPHPGAGPEARNAQNEPPEASFGQVPGLRPEMLIPEQYNTFYYKGRYLHSTIHFTIRVVTCTVQYI